ncbi:MAG: DUF5683 domain-containing protein [Bacteroidales bacterium]|nr:DUF5683 domain-containing protein [Bacteroidales bacterium]
MSLFIHNNRNRAKAVAFALFALLSGVSIGQNVSEQKLTEATPASIIEKPHSPNKALVLSAILPGAGQVYNHQAWKIPIVYTGLGGVGYLIYNNYQKMTFFKEEYLYRVNHDDTPLDASYTSYPTTNIYNLYESYSKNFQLYIFVEAAIYGLNLLDAYVFGHLFDFEINDDLSLQMYPSLQYQPSAVYLGGNSLAPTLSLSLRF